MRGPLDAFPRHFRRLLLGNAHALGKGWIMGSGLEKTVLGWIPGNLACPYKKTPRKGGGIPRRKSLQQVEAEAERHIARL
jgi:hypothetical protein